ncbi:MAG: hypothetical protein AMXMBFR84_46370 [Candidatus Hydrogenedentota bacterium]
MSKILIVDDDAAMAGTLQGLLSSAGHVCAVDTACTDVVATIRQVVPDLLILDVMLPHQSGFEICRRVRRDAELYTLPILLLSAMSGEEEIFHGLAQGADDFVAKPYDTMNLVQRVDALIRMHGGGKQSDPLTTLPAAETTKREIQRRISCDDTFALIHCEMFGMREFAKLYGSDARAKSIRHVARIVNQCARELSGDDTFSGHMGGGHFITIMPAEHVKKYCAWVRKVWDSHVDRLYSDVGAKPDSKRKETLNRDLDVLMCVTIREQRDVATPKSLFETLSQLRHKAIEDRSSGAYYDKRAH